MLLLGRATTGVPGSKTWPSTVGERVSRHFVKILRYGPKNLCLPSKLTCLCLQEAEVEPQKLTVIWLYADVGIFWIYPVEEIGFLLA
jgi:hypothetical protein